MSIKNPRNTIGQRKKLRKNQTNAEELFWEAVRKKKVLGLRFKRQYGIGPYILDFFVAKKNLAIEIDGKIHEKEEVFIKDRNKDAFLSDNGISVLRIKNELVEQNLEKVILELKAHLQRIN